MANANAFDDFSAGHLSDEQYLVHTQVHNMEERPKRNTVSCFGDEEDCSRTSEMHILEHRRGSSEILLCTAITPALCGLYLERCHTQLRRYGILIDHDSKDNGASDDCLEMPSSHFWISALPFVFHKCLWKSVIMEIGSPDG